MRDARREPRAKGGGPGGMWLAEIWRYPVKSMGGERLDEAVLRTTGIVGDRVVLAIDLRGRVVTARRHPRLLGFHARLGADGEPLVDTRPWRDLEVQGAVERIAGSGTRLVRYDGVERFDILPLLITSDGALAKFGHDPRRLRPNLVIGGVPGLAEREWEGRRLQIGEAVVEAADLRGRCVMTTVHPDTLQQDHNVLRDIATRFGGTFGLNTAVVQGGVIREGDPVELLD